MTDTDKTPSYETPYVVQLKILFELEKQTALLTEMRNLAMAAEERANALLCHDPMKVHTAEDSVELIEAARIAVGLPKTRAPLPTTAEIRACINSRMRKALGDESPR